jgi:hypothetical protein
MGSCRFEMCRNPPSSRLSRLCLSSGGISVGVVASLMQSVLFLVIMLNLCFRRCVECRTFLATAGPIPVAARSKAWDCGFESSRGHGCLSVVSVVCCQVEVSASGRSLVQRSPTDCGVSECDREASTMKRPCPTRGC